MKTTSPDKAYDDEFSERLLESIEALKASFGKLHTELKPVVLDHSQQLEELQEQVLELQSRIRRRWREIILLDDDGIEHRVAKSGFMHITYVAKEPKDGATRKFPLPTTGFPCLRVFSATFPGVCYDFRVTGEIPLIVLRPKTTSKEDRKKVLNDRAFLYELASRFVDGGGFTLRAREYDDVGKLSIQVNTYQYQH